MGGTNRENVHGASALRYTLAPLLVSAMGSQTTETLLFLEKAAEDARNTHPEEPLGTRTWKCPFHKFICKPGGQQRASETSGRATCGLAEGGCKLPQMFLKRLIFIVLE